MCRAAGADRQQTHLPDEEWSPDGDRKLGLRADIGRNVAAVVRHLRWRTGTVIETSCYTVADFCIEKN